MQASVYVLECEEGAWYVGLSSNPYRRYIRHISGDGSQYTSHYKPKRIAHVFWYSSRTKAKYMEEVMTCLMRDQALKVGGGLRTAVGVSGRGKCIVMISRLLATLPDVLVVKLVIASGLEKTAVVV